jgi:hypothetical protein
VFNQLSTTPWIFTGECRCSYINLDLSIRWRLSGQFSHPSHFTPTKRALVPTGSKTGWALEPVWRLWSRENLLPYQESNPGHPYHSYTELSQLLVRIYSSRWSSNITSFMKIIDTKLLFILIIDISKTCFALMTLQPFNKIFNESQRSLYNEIYIKIVAENTELYQNCSWNHLRDAENTSSYSTRNS